MVEQSSDQLKESSKLHFQLQMLSTGINQGQTHIDTQLDLVLDEVLKLQGPITNWFEMSAKQLKLKNPLQGKQLVGIILDIDNSEVQLTLASKERLKNVSKDHQFFLNLDQINRFGANYFKGNWNPIKLSRPKPQPARV